MKFKFWVFLALILSIVAFTCFAQDTNSPAPSPSSSPSAASNTIQPLLDLLGGKGTFITTIIAWFAAISMALAPFAIWIRNKLADSMNESAASSNMDDDAYLRKLFSNKIYRFAAFILNFANVRFPTIVELERAIELQAEAVKDSKT